MVLVRDVIVSGFWFTHFYKLWLYFSFLCFGDILIIHLWNYKGFKPLTMHGGSMVQSPLSSCNHVIFVSKLWYIWMNAYGPIWQKKLKISFCNQVSCQYWQFYTVIEGCHNWWYLIFLLLFFIRSLIVSSSFTYLKLTNPWSVF